MRADCRHLAVFGSESLKYIFVVKVVIVKFFTLSKRLDLRLLSPLHVKLLFLRLEQLYLLLTFGLDELAVKEGVILGVFIKLLYRVHGLGLELLKVALGQCLWIHYVLKHVGVHDRAGGCSWLVES